jgi:acyl-homoserine-lactone acylase
VRKARGALDVPWGDVYRLRVGGRDLPANGGPGELGIFRVVNFTEDQDGRMRAASGDSYVATIEFGPTVRARSLVSYGNASQPGSPHVGDQLDLFAKKALKPVWLTRQEIEQNLERRETIRR